MKSKLIILIVLSMFMFSGCSLWSEPNTNINIDDGVLRNDSGASLVNPYTNSINTSTINNNLDAFGRLRVSEPFGIFDNKNIQGCNPNIFNQIVNGTANITCLTQESAVNLSVGTNAGDRAIRQTLRYFPYIPGKSQLITLTGVMGEKKAGVEKRIGYYDDNDGLFFGVNETDVYVARRNSATGTVQEFQVPQSEWNMDELDGSCNSDNPSCIELNITQSQIFIIDFQWLGVGRVRFGFEIDGETIYVHELLNANHKPRVYMKSGSLPIRYEIENIANTASPSNIKEICSAIASEGGYQLPGYEFSINMGITPSIVGNTREPILAIRLKDNVSEGVNRFTAKLLKYNFFTDGGNVLYEIVHVHEPNINATWVNVDNSSKLEYTTNINSVNGTHIHVIESIYSSPGNRGGSIVANVGNINNHAFISQNYYSNNSEIFLVYATGFTNNIDVAAALTWIEFN